MAIKFSCPSCGKRIGAPDEAAGHAGWCPMCKQRLIVPLASEPAPATVGTLAAARAAEEPVPSRTAPSRPETMSEAAGEPGRAEEYGAPPAAVTAGQATVIRFACASCGGTVSAPASTAGKTGKCPVCASPITVPQASSPLVDGAGQTPPRPSSTAGPPSDRAVSVSPPLAAPSGARPPPLPTAKARRAPSTAPVPGSRVEVHDLQDVIRTLARSQPPPMAVVPSAFDLKEHVWLQPDETVVAKYYALRLAPRFRILSFLFALLLSIPTLGVALLVYILWLFERLNGVIVLTNRRFIYVGIRKVFLYGSWENASINIDTISSVNCYYQHGIKKFLGLFISKEKLGMMLEVRSGAGTFKIGNVTHVGRLGGPPLAPADDGLQMTQQLGSLVIEIQNRLKGV